MRKDDNLLLFPELREEAKTPEPLPPDAAARTEALDIRRSFVVEAPAGSGKTGLLIQRYLKLLGDESVTSPEQVLAITFTKKAAGEMRDRVLGHLEAARNGTPVAKEFDRVTRQHAEAVLARDRQLEWNLLEQPQRINLRTIDSICAEIARSLPLLSGAGGALRPTEQASALLDEAARRTFGLLGSGEDARLELALEDVLLHRDANLEDCERLLSEMLSVRDQWAKLIPLERASLDDAALDAEVLPQLERALKQAIAAGLERIAQIFPGEILAELADIAGHLGHRPSTKAEVSLVACCAGIHAIPGARADDLERWLAIRHLLLTGGGDWRKALQANHLGFELKKNEPLHQRLTEVLKQLSMRVDLQDELNRIALLPPPTYPANQWAVAKNLFHVLRRGLAELKVVFAERGECDFTELTLLARAALSSETGPEDLATALGSRLQHLLVDEMQDTSSGQYELLELLTQAWDGYSQTVFLVGDPRQSIYLFRQARVERFVDTLRTERLGELPLKHLRLTANFRSQRGLVEQFNEDFGAVFATAANGEATMPYGAADAVLPKTEDEGRRWHAAPVPIPKAGQENVDENGQPDATGAQLRQRQARRNAQAICAVIQRWSERRLSEGRREPWKIGVLVRNRPHLAEVATALRTRGIAFRAVEIEALNERQEILDLLALTRAILHPGDRAAWLALLRAPWCGLSLADLHRLTGEDDGSLSKASVLRLMEERGDLVSPDAGRRMRRIWSALAAAERQRGRLSTAQRVERTWRTLGGDAWLSPDRLSNAQRFFGLLDEMESEPGSGVDVAVLQTRLMRLYAEPQAIAEGMPTVELLTIHRAKGLEWDVVCIPALERGAGRGRARLLEWAELGGGDDAASVMLAPIAARGDDPDRLTTWLKKLRLGEEGEERKRLFYVAATRARQELHLFGSPDLSETKLRYAWDSLLKAAWPAAEPYFASAAGPESSIARETSKPKSGTVDLAAGEVVEIGLREVAETAPETLDETLYREPQRPPIERLPESFDPAERLARARAERLPDHQRESVELDATEVEFRRPEGGFAARAYGTVAHALLELMAARLIEGRTLEELRRDVAGWGPRIAAMLRANGLAPAEVSRLTHETEATLANVLADRDGAWVLNAHHGGATEFALTAAREQTLTSIRVDRLFYGGARPHAEGSECLWIVDYKTAAHGARGLDTFLEEQRAAYAPQLESYARILADARGVAPEQMRVALYYPGLPRLVWWIPEARS